MKVKEHLYANQFVPLWEDVTLQEKFTKEGDLADRLSGGGIIHYSCGERVTPKQALAIINLAAKTKVAQFAINPCYSICEDGHYSFGKHKMCPKDGKPIKKYLSRVVGFWTTTDNWSTAKREYDFERRHYNKVDI